MGGDKGGDKGGDGGGDGGNMGGDNGGEGGGGGDNGRQENPESYICHAVRASFTIADVSPSIVQAHRAAPTGVQPGGQAVPGCPHRMPLL